MSCAYRNDNVAASARNHYQMKYAAKREIICRQSRMARENISAPSRHRREKPLIAYRDEITPG